MLGIRNQDIRMERVDESTELLNMYKMITYIIKSTVIRFIENEINKARDTNFSCSIARRGLVGL